MSNAKNPTVDPRLVANMKRAANKLHHVSMAYVGAMKELATGQPIFGLPADHPGLHMMRDMIDLILLTRAEINAITNILVGNRLMTLGQFTMQVTEEYDYIIKIKGEQFKCEVTDIGLIYKIENPIPPEENN